jgi:hypothetical protein
MRCAPPVQMTCGRDGGWMLAELLVHALAAASLAGWLAARLAPGTTTWWAAMAALAAAALVWRHRRDMLPHSLAWDGREWFLDGHPARLSLMMAGPSWALLRAQVPARGAVTWLPVRLSRCGAPPHLARAALHAHG